MRRLAAAGFLLLTYGCGGQPAQSPSPTESPLAQASGRLGAEVPMPNGFPVDMPVYPKARLISAAGFPSAAPTSWGMEWQSVDTVAKVQAYYSDKLNQGDWSLSATSNANGEFKATFGRKSDRSVIGTLDVTGNSGSVTKILMSLVT